ETLKQYIGIYELQPGFNIEVSVKDGKLFAQATGQGEFELFAEEKDKFFLKVVVANVHFFRNAEGHVVSLTLFQGGQEMPGKKVN
ncbi:DUF3471 domain-containing protein, partial [Psychroserpens damuponensis]|uniref:DUF3471 domain-containing protein n=1 Tax=Psychroserpens damuponensis TaxID=943936 RepID=UPI000590661F